MRRLAGAVYRVHSFLSAPSRRNFFIYLGMLWILNAADIWQTSALKSSGDLASEANQFVSYLLMKGPLYFVTFKILAITLVTLVVVRGYFDDKGIRVGETFYNATQVRTAIQFMLVVANFYYLLVVFLPLILIVVDYRMANA